MQHTIHPPVPSPLGDALLPLLADARPAFRQQRTYFRAMALVGFLHSLARHTLTQTLLAIGCVDADWSAFYRLFSRDRIPIAQLQRRLIVQVAQHVPPDQTLMLAVDGVAFPRSGRRIPGVGWRKAPGTALFRAGLALAQRFGALHWLPPLVHGYSRAIPLVSYPIFTPKAQPAHVPPQKEWEGALQALLQLRTVLTMLGRTTQPVALLADGSYDVAAFWKALPPHTTLLARTARNRRLCHLPPSEPLRRGPRRKYGAAAPRSGDSLAQRRGWTERTIQVRGHGRRVRYRADGPFLRAEVADQPVFLVLLGGQTYRWRQQPKYREPVPVLVNAVRQADGRWALPLPLVTIVAWRWQRWEVEVAHRELKSGFGVGRCSAGRV